jgi:anthranilate synthase component II
MAAPPRLLMIDNVDSFTFMLVDYLRVAGANVRVARNDAVGPAEAFGDEFDGLVISPGPGRPEQAGCSVAVAGACIAARKPLLEIRKLRKFSGRRDAAEVESQYA